MKKNIKILSILILAGFSFFYTDKVVNIIKNNDPLMAEIKNASKSKLVTKIDRVEFDDSYLTGVNGCVVNEEESYDKMKVVGEFKEELLVMKEDKQDLKEEKYIVGGNTKKRKVSIILFDINLKVDEHLNYFLNGKYISENIGSLLTISKSNNIYNFGRDGYDKKYLIYDNSVINNNFNNKSEFCLVENKDKEILDLCSNYNMKTIKVESIENNHLNLVKESLTSGKIYSFKNIDKNTLMFITRYIKSKGYTIVGLDELLDESNSC